MSKDKFDFERFNRTRLDFLYEPMSGIMRDYDKDVMERVVSKLRGHIDSTDHISSDLAQAILQHDVSPHLTKSDVREIVRWELKEHNSNQHNPLTFGPWAKGIVREIVDQQIESHERYRTMLHPDKPEGVDGGVGVYVEPGDVVVEDKTKRAYLVVAYDVYMKRGGVGLEYNWEIYVLTDNFMPYRLGKTKITFNNEPVLGINNDTQPNRNQTR